MRHLLPGDDVCNQLTPPVPPIPYVVISIAGHPLSLTEGSVAADRLVTGTADHTRTSGGPCAGTTSPINCRRGAMKPGPRGHRQGDPEHAATAVAAVAAVVAAAAAAEEEAAAAAEEEEVVLPVFLRSSRRAGSTRGVVVSCGAGRPGELFVRRRLAAKQRDRRGRA